MHLSLLRRLCLVAVPFSLLPMAPSQWQPSLGQWRKSHAADLRVMTWNVKRGLCRLCPKGSGATPWDALTRIVAALRPDVLVLQEAGGSSGGVDTEAQLEATLELFMHGGSDPFLGGNATAYVQEYAPSYDLPHIYVSGVSDGFIRNAVLSRYPFRDLNGDGLGVIADIPTVSATAWIPTTGSGGIRGFGFAEIDLPDELYRGDLVVGHAHLKSGNSASDRQRRLEASQRVAYVVDYWFQGAGGSIPDPAGTIADTPSATKVLDSHTAIVLGGDWNEDESSNGRRGPALWLTEAARAGGTDGTDRDRSDMTYDAATHPVTGSSRTHWSGSKLDYLAWQDSISSPRRAFVFHSNIALASLPEELIDFPAPTNASDLASDHRPVVVDLILPHYRARDLAIPRLPFPSLIAPWLPFGREHEHAR